MKNLVLELHQPPLKYSSHTGSVTATRDGTDADTAIIAESSVARHCSGAFWSDGGL